MPQRKTIDVKKTVKKPARIALPDVNATRATRTFRDFFRSFLPGGNPAKTGAPALGGPSSTTAPAPKIVQGTKLPDPARDSLSARPPGFQSPIAVPSLASLPAPGMGSQATPDAPPVSAYHTLGAEGDAPPLAKSGGAVIGSGAAQRIVFGRPIRLAEE